MYQPDDKLAVAYASNAKVYPVGEIIKGVVEIYCNKPFQIPALESVVLSAEILDRYVGVYTAQDAPDLADALAKLADGVLTHHYEVTETPHRELCATCPGRPALCCWDESRTLAPKHVAV